MPPRSPPFPLPAGLYDQLLTQGVASALERARAERWHIDDHPLDPADAHERLAAHVRAELARALRALPAEDRLAAQIALCNRLLDDLAAATGGAATEPGAPLDAAVVAPGRVLRAVSPTPEAPPHPTTPLSATTLLTRAAHEPRLAAELPREVESADAIDLLMAFIKWSGLRILWPSLERFVRAGRSMRVLTTVYMGATDAHALDALARLPGVEVRVSHDTRRTRLHAKAWLFRRRSGFSTAYVGSSNVSAAALDDGLEWNLRASQADAPHIIEKFRGTFESLWNDAEFERYHPDDAAAAARLAAGLRAERAGERRAPELFFDLRPFPYQAAILDRLSVERQALGRRRSLVVAATGTGKTVVAALDYRRQLGPDGVRPRLLFVAHRKELLEQAMLTFRHALRDSNFGELLAEGRAPARYDHLFATIQGLSAGDVASRFPPEHWDMVVIDEFHHATAPSYDRLLSRIRPRLLLGLTATPERADGMDVLRWFEGHIAAELRLWEALEQRLLSPFEYHGIADTVDLRGVTWSRGSYDTGELTNLYTANDVRVRLVLQKIRDIVGRPERMRALGFCVSIEHAEFMARRFSEAGVPSLAVHGRSPDELRREAPDRLRRLEVNALFTVDLFNEGVDIPEVDTLLLLRPTESATVFLQQIGRGLRLWDGKDRAVILDFIGQARREFRFDRRFSRLTGIARGRLPEAIARGFPYLPSGCHVQLEEKAQEYVLENVRQAIRGGLGALGGELRELAARRGAVTLQAFLDESGRSLEEVYRAGGWTAVRQAAGQLPAGLDEAAALSARFEQILHVDDPARLSLYRAIAGGEALDVSALGEVDRRRLVMLWLRVRRQGEQAASLAEVVTRLRASAPAREELAQLCDALRTRLELLPQSCATLPAKWALAVHARYMRDEVLAALGQATLTRVPPSREGVLWLPEQQADLLFVTLDKSGKTFSPTTSYEDYAMSPELFHWQSQSTTSAGSETGRRYVEHERRGSHVLLFVRERPQGAYTFLGPARYVSHEGSRPMSVVWRLAVPLPEGQLPRYRTLLAG